MIEDIKNRKKMEKEKQDDDTVDKPSTSTDSGNTSDDKDQSCVPSTSDITFQDSDSDEFCPLQHYVNLNDSSSQSVTATPEKIYQNITVSNEVFENSAKLLQNLTENNKEKQTKSSKNVSSSLYEMPTDVSTDDDIPSSPVLCKNVKRKRVRVSNKSLNKSNSSQSSFSILDDDDSLEKKSREAAAKSMCNSIMKDFSTEGFSDDSSSEFVNKRT